MIVSTSRPRAARKSLLAGLDMDMMSEAFAAHMVELVNEGCVPESLVTEAGLRGRQQELLDDVAATGKPLVCVLMSGRPLVLPRPAGELDFHGLDMRYIVEPGAFKLWVGPDSASGLEGSSSIT
jgi:hypothetical protein